MNEPGRGAGTGGRGRGLTAGAALLLAVIGWAGAADGAAGAERLASRAAADVVLVAEGDVVADDLYAAGQVITINGLVEGDLFFWAADRLEINGEVTGNVTGAAGTMRINGRVGGSVRVVGWDLAAGGSVGRDLFGIGWRVAVDGAIGRDVLAWTRNLAAGGSVGRDIAGQARGTALLSGGGGRDIAGGGGGRAWLSGGGGGDVDMTVNRLRVAAGADIAEDLVYRSPRSATVSEQATVGGNLIRRPPLVPNLSVGAASTALTIAIWLFYMIVGLLVIRIPGYGQAAQRVRARPWFSLGWGAVMLLGLPLLFALALWVIIVFAGWNLWIALGAALVGASLVAGLGIAAGLCSIPALIATGRWLSRGRLSPYGAFALVAGAVGLSLLLAPFYIGQALLGAAALLGAGAAFGEPRKNSRLTRSPPGNTC